MIRRQQILSKMLFCNILHFVHGNASKAQQRAVMFGENAWRTEKDSSNQSELFFFFFLVGYVEERPW